jgi:hypothetical protein
MPKMQIPNILFELAHSYNVESLAGRKYPALSLELKPQKLTEEELKSKIRGIVQ